MQLIRDVKEIERYSGREWRNIRTLPATEEVLTGVDYDGPIDQGGAAPAFKLLAKIINDCLRIRRW